MYYRVFLDGDCVGVSRDFEHMSDALYFAKELLLCNEAYDYPVSIKRCNDGEEE